jgi:hypothetical protein
MCSKSFLLISKAWGSGACLSAVDGRRLQALFPREWGARVANPSRLHVDRSGCEPVPLESLPEAPGTTQQKPRGADGAE